MKRIILACLIALMGTRSLLGMEAIDRFLAWNEANLRAVELSSPSPCLVARNFAIIQGAAFEALNAVDPRFFSEFEGIPPATPGIDPELASLAALWHGSVTLFPSYRAVYDELWRSQRALWPEARETDEAVAFGLAVADACLRSRADDGASGTITYLPKSGAGKWRRTPPRYRPPELPHWPRLKPFVIERAEQFRPPPPPALDSVEYAAAVDEVRRLGRAVEASRKKEAPVEIAHFWSCFSYTATPSGHWNEIAAILARQEGLDLTATSRMFAILNLALADAGIAAWECKYHYEFWRPVQAIREAGADGNPFTTADPDWRSELEAPPHPEYVSGHSAFSGAGARLLAHLLGGDALAFAVTSKSVPGVTLQYDSLEACSDEIGMSRLYGGIHFRFSNQAGLEMGRALADWVAPRVYPPIPGR